MLEVYHSTLAIIRSPHAALDRFLQLSEGGRCGVGGKDTGSDAGEEGGGSI